MMRAPSLPHDPARAERTADGFCAVHEVGELAQLGRTPRVGLGGFDDESATAQDFGIHGPFGVRVRLTLAAGKGAFHGA